MRLWTGGSSIYASRVGGSWPWSMDRSGSASTRRPAGGRERQSTWASHRLNRSSTPTWMATARRRFLRSSPTKGAYPLTDPTLAAFSIATGKRLWAEKLMAFFRPQVGVAAREWILAADFDGDGCAEVVVPDVGALPPRNLGLYGGVHLLDGRTGKTRWVGQLWPGMKSGSDTLAHAAGRTRS